MLMEFQAARHVVGAPPLDALFTGCMSMAKD